MRFIFVFSVIVAIVTTVAINAVPEMGTAEETRLDVAYNVDVE